MKQAQHSRSPLRAAKAWAERLNTHFWSSLAEAAEVSGARGMKMRTLKAVRVLVLAALSFNVNEVPVRASSLVFTTLLAFIPLTIILSSVAGWLGYLDLLRGLIPYFMDSLNLDISIDPLLRGIERAESIGFHRLGLWGSLGLLIGFYISMSSVEEAMNRVWNVRRKRSWPARFARYTPFLLLLLAVLVLSVFLLFRMQQFMANWGFDRAFNFSVPGSALLFGSLGALVLLWMVMVLMIRLLPNTRVRLPSAFIGAFAGIVPLYLLSRVLLLFPRVFLERNQIFYGSLAIFPVALLLVYAFWVCVLFGSAVAFVQGKLARETGHSFFARGAGIREDWEEAVHETEALYQRSHTKTKARNTKK